MRAFLAIVLPEEVRTVLSDLRRQLAASGADVKWAEGNQVHLTLRFLGEITEDQRGAVEQLLADIGARRPPFRIGLEGLGAFPSTASPRVIWVGVKEGREHVVRIAQAFEDGVRAIGLRREERPFTAHVTLGRVRSPRRRQLLTERLHRTVWPPPPPWHVTSLRLYQSVLSAPGPHYTVLAEVPLKGPEEHPLP